jgi:serine/arginine repetitive matrix protein 2
MYNGVGVLTPRGTGSSGYVTTNKFNLRRAPVPKFGDGAAPPPQHADRKPNKEILEHNRRRQMEIKLLEMRDALEEAG